MKGGREEGSTQKNESITGLGRVEGEGRGVQRNALMRGSTDPEIRSN